MNMNQYKLMPEEDECAYVSRMQSLYLPNWPEEVLISWLWRHNNNGLPDLFPKIDPTQLLFTKESWSTSKIPGKEVFHSLWPFEDVKNSLELYALEKDWLAEFMLKNGTWNIGVILLETENRIIKMSITDEEMKRPYHLLEGHTRLSYLNRLIELGKSADKHDIWIAKIK